MGTGPWLLAPRRVAHLSLHAADTDQLVEDQQGPVDSIVSIHALLFGQGLIKPFLCFFKCVLKREDVVQGYNTAPSPHTHTRGSEAIQGLLVPCVSTHTDL